ncbi:MAG: Uma2 family endonuclease [Anaerolineae bacterium]|nr:Uma2 family endonuclease [Anaerolineae bacterium]
MALPKTHMTPEEYLTFERASEEKHEYYAGEIFAMTGASENHNLIAGSTYAALYAQLRKRPCNVYPSDMRVKVHATGLYTYPDITIVCGTPELEDNNIDTLLNPTVIIEVLSPSTEAYDRGKKFRHYKTIKSLQDYILISQDSMRIEHFALRDNEWVYADAEVPNAVITLPSIDCTLRLSDVYEKITFDKPEGLH